MDTSDGHLRLHSMLRLEEHRPLCRILGLFHVVAACCMLPMTAASLETPTFVGDDCMVFE